MLVATFMCVCVCVLGSELVKRRKLIYSWDGPRKEPKELSVGKC